MKKKIMAISNHGHLLGGGEHSFLDLLSHLPQPWKVIAVLPGWGDLAEKLLKRNIESKIIPLPPIRPWTVHRIIVSLLEYYRLGQLLKPGLIYANGSRAMFYGGLIGRVLKIPVIWHCRIVRPDKYLDWLLMRLCHRVIVNSHATAGRFKSDPLGKVKVVYNGIDLSHYLSSSFIKPNLIQENWNVLLTVARVSRDKRHDIVLKAFELVADQEPSLHLVLIGAKDLNDPAWWDGLQTKTIQSPFADRIHWVGPQDNLLPWYQAADLLVLASENESFGRVLVEAMVCGVPVIAVESGGVPEIIRQGKDGLLVPAGNPDALAAAIQSILKNPSLRQKFVTSGNQRAFSFNLDDHVRQMTAVFENILQS